jgi:drug/metabolite transporter superfamily protein YnfA
MKFILVFLFTALSECIWTFYICSTAKEKAGLASFFSCLTVLMGLVVTIVVVDSPKYIIPATIGAWAGTYLTVSYMKGKKK